MKQLLRVLLSSVFIISLSFAQNTYLLEREQNLQDQYHKAGTENSSVTQSVSIQNQSRILNSNNLMQKGSDGVLATLPEVLYYTFDEAASPTQNFADPGRGSAFADVLGGLSMGSTGQFDGALIGSGNSSSTDYVNTGWIPDIGTSSWTISMWLNNLPAGTSLYYFFGGDVSVAWRCFYGGSAGEYGVMMRHPTGNGTDITVPGVGPGPTVLTFVYDSTVPVIYAYLNGVLTVTQPQAGQLDIGGATVFKVGGYGTVGAALPAGSLMDEFRFYDRALDSAEVADTWNISVIPVELTSFTVSAAGSDVQLSWSTATELNNSGFKIQRKSAGSDYVEIGFVPGFGTVSEPKSYSFTDNNLENGVYTYRLKQVDFDGTFTYSDAVDVQVVKLFSYNLEQNYPNPFNPVTEIRYSIPQRNNVSLKVFDMLGNEIRTLVNGEKEQGTYTVSFDAADLSSGMYLCRLQAGSFIQTRKMILLK